LLLDVKFKSRLWGATLKINIFYEKFSGVGNNFEKLLE
jgi:hypothetical protein